jgi:hypothetical protein
MGINIGALQEKRRVDRLRSLKVEGRVIEKRMMGSGIQIENVNLRQGKCEIK